MSDTAKANRRLVLRMLIVASAMFAFGVFGMPPLYERFCEITGIGQAGVRVAAMAPKNAAQDRTVRVRFDATTNSALPWKFEPVERFMDVRVGMPMEAGYIVRNREESEVVGRAVYNVTPPAAGLYFVKTECFCFVSQILAAGEEKEMPVRFYIDPDLPQDIEELTLSYTFFLDQGGAAVAGVGPGGSSID